MSENSEKKSVMAEVIINVVFCLTRSLKFKDILIYSDINERKTANPHMYKAWTSKCFAIKKKKND